MGLQVEPWELLLTGGVLLGNVFKCGHRERERPECVKPYNAAKPESEAPEYPPLPLALLLLAFCPHYCRLNGKQPIYWHSS